MLPPRIIRKSDKADTGKRSPAHRTFVRSHACSACGTTTAIECAHVRTGTNGGLGMKPSDAWTINLCRDCHEQQHRIGETPFEIMHAIDMKKLAKAFYLASPHRAKLENPNV